VLYELSPEADPSLWQGLVEGIRDGFFFAHDEQGILRYLSPAAGAILGQETDALLGRSFEALLEVRVAEEEPRNWLGVRSGAFDLRRISRSDGGIVELAVRSYPVLAAGGVVWTGGHAQDVTKQLEIQRRLSHDATHDPLTGLANRVLLDARLRQVVARRGREIDARFALLMLDLDGFKQVNDSYGHDAGDRVLRGVAERITRSVRPGDTVCRSGGDEFLILIEDVERVEDVIGVARRILDALSLPFDLAPGMVTTSASVGILEGEVGNGVPEDIVRWADATMYEAKRLGRNRYAVQRTGHGGPSAGQAPAASEASIPHS
jgi:diguanylate cyclase (GGDEF)-like protein/PAS domain S-box-containing protein